MARKIIPIRTPVRVSGPASQWPFERISQPGVVQDWDRHAGYLVALEHNRESLFFRRRDLVPAPELAGTLVAESFVFPPVAP